MNTRGYSYSGDNIIDNVAWYLENADTETKPVGQKSGNELGIYDMSGNVWEYCQGGIICGGSWMSPGNGCMVNSSKSAGGKDYTKGFRLVVSN